MRVLVSFAFSLLLAFCHGQGCDLSQEALMKTAMECLSHDPSLMLQIIEHMEHPDDMANMKFVCSNQKDILDVAMCMEKKMLKCLPKEVQPLVVTLVVRERLQAALSFACQHQAALLDDCMDDEATAEFSSCMSTEAQNLMASLGDPSTFGVQNLLCRYTSVFKRCLSAHSGSCSQSMTDVYDQVFEMMLPEHHCDKQNLDQIKNGAASKLLGSLLLRGQPLLSGPTGKMGPVYNYKMGRN